MNRLRLLAPITHVVQVKETHPGGGQSWETIAAFNVKVAAEMYADECHSNAFRTAEYRVLGTRAADQIRVENSDEQ